MYLSKSSSEQMREKNNIQKKPNPFLNEIFGKKLHAFLVLYQDILKLTKKSFNGYQFISSNYHVLLSYVLLVFFPIYYKFLILFATFICCRSKRIKNLNKISYLLCLSKILSKKERKKNTKLNNVAKTISNNFKMNIHIIITLIILKLNNHEKIYVHKQHIEALNRRDRFGNNEFIHSFMPIWRVGQECEKENIDQGRSYSQKNITISHCFFLRYSVYSLSGGVIFNNGGSYIMDLTHSMFFNCVCNQHGGAIFSYSTISNLRMICANRCSCGASLWGNYAYLQASQVNLVEYLSVSYCSNNTSGLYSIYFASGIQSVDNINSSMNNAKKFSGILISSPSSFTSSLCTFSNNKVSDSICISLSSNTIAISISYAIIVHNNSPSLGVVHVDGLGSKKMLHCIFQNNHNFLFYVESGSLEVSHSFIDNPISSFSNNLAVSTTNNSFTYVMTYQIQFFKSHHCNADIPLPQTTPDQSPMIESICKTNERTKGNIPRTYVELICTSQLSNKRGINIVFSFIYFSYIQ